jgi:hypothetical protein
MAPAVIYEQFIGPVRCAHSGDGRCAGAFIHSCRGRYRDGGACGETAIDCRAGPLLCCRDNRDDWAFDRAQLVAHDLRLEVRP